MIKVYLEYRNMDETLLLLLLTQFYGSFGKSCFCYLAAIKE